MFTKTELIESWRKQDYPGKLLLALVFLFPTLSLSVRHWLSGIFSLLFLAGLLVIWKGGKRLYREEKVLFAIIAAHLVVFVISATLNGWTENSYRRIGTEFKYLMFFSIYLYVRRYPEALKFFLAGILIGAVMLGAQALYDTIYTSHHRGMGIYGPIIFGDLGVLLLGALLVVRTEDKPENIHKNFLLYVGIVMAGIAVYLSGSRNAWLAVIVILLVLGVIYRNRVNPRKLLIRGAIIILVAGLVSSYFAGALYDRANVAVGEVQEYLNIKEYRKGELAHSSAGIRLEQWKTISKLFLERPIWGFGAGNAGREINRYIEQGKAHPDIYNSDAETNIVGVHSAYFGKLGTEGIMGLAALLAMLLYPLYVFYKNRHIDHSLFALGSVFSIGFMVFATTENPFVHDNFTSLFLIFLSVFFSALMNRKYVTHA